MARANVRHYERRPDVHELLKREMLTPDASQRCAPGEQYVLLDSFCKLRESRTDQGEFRWNLMVQGVTGDQVVGVRDTLDFVGEVHVGQFAMPVLPEVPYAVVETPPTGSFGLLKNNTNLAVTGGPYNTLTVVPQCAPTLVPTAGVVGQYPAPALLTGTSTTIPWTSNPYTQLPFGSRFTMQIREAGLQSFSDFGGARHHFEFAARYSQLDGVNPTAMLAAPASGDTWERFAFAAPLQDLHGITLVFRNPDRPLVFEPDVLYGAAVTVVANRVVLQFTKHGLTAGDRFFVTLESTGTGNVALDAYLTRAEGHVAGNIIETPAAAPGTALPADQFATDPIIDTTTVAGLVMPRPVTIRVAKRRLRIPMRICRAALNRT